MQIEYNKADQTIEIKDDIKTHYFALKIVLGLNALTGILNLAGTYKSGVGFIELFWIFMLVTALVFLYYFTFRKSVAVLIPLHQIKYVKQRSILGRKQFSLVLQNGKSRDIPSFKKQADVNQLKALCQELGILMK
ncbi:hypothetical protein [Cellulophaga sp. Hel_I_12]|uniref:hypothetical protein n=1 Tax=Cellulophaga sp. Hel_I_12 TaxID=1249972 RepID=UPI0006486C95|nr:hypothetical protein [Cellulophaga sp. Hel_I_12]